jgi:O-antigen ligase
VASPDLLTGEPRESAPLVTAKPRFALLDSILLYGTFSLLLFGPLASGAVEPWAIFVLQAGATLLLLLWTIRQLASGALEVMDNPLFAPMLVFAALIAIQIVFGLTAYRFATVSGALLYCAYGGLAFLSVQMLRRTSQVKRLAWAFSAYGLLVALFALIQSLSSNGKVYWLREPRAGGWIYGPYVNHNHYAGLMEMLFPIPLVIALSGHVRGYWKLVPGFAFVIMATTIFLSGSRGGMLAFVVQMVVLGILIGMQKSRQTALSAGAVLVVIAGLMLWVGGESMVGRMASIHTEAKTELEGGLRLTVDRDGVKMFAKKPVLGWGLRTFPVAYPQFRSFFTDKIVNEAHDDYLQVLVEMGALGFLTTLWFLVLVYRGSMRKLTSWTWDLNGAVAMAALLGITGILVHSFVDFNLQIPANAALFYVLCTIAAAETKFGANRRIRRKRTAGPELELSSASTQT